MTSPEVAYSKEIHKFDIQHRPSQKSTIHAIPAIVVPESDDHVLNNKKPSFFDKLINYFLCRRRKSETKNSKVKPVSILALFRYAKKFDCFLLTIGTICAIISGIAQPILALVAGRVINTLLVYPATSKEFRNKATENVFIFLGLGIFVSFTNWIQYICFYQCCSRIMSQVRQRYIQSILRQNAGWFDENHSGAIVSEFHDNIEKMQQGIGEKLGVTIRGLSMFTAAVVISYIYQWRLACLMLGVAPVCVLCMGTMTLIINKTTARELTGVGKAGSIAEESLMGVKTVQAFNGQQEMIEKYSNELRKGRSFAIKRGFWGGLFGGFFFFWMLAFLSCGILYGAYLLEVRIIKRPGDIITVVFSMLLGSYFLGLTTPHIMYLLSIRTCVALIYRIIDRVPKIDIYSTNGKILDNVQGSVTFQNVHFRYPTRKDAKILNGLNLTVNPGSCVALVGHSGCGKSTSVGLLTRLYEAEAGSVMIDGVDVKELNIEHLRNIIGIVQQEPALFNDSIHNNLLVGKLEATREQMIKVCEMANAHEFIIQMPKGYDTIIGDGGVQLSGGQKQRIAIARTLLRDPKILLLDEATSALDAESESIVQQALNNASKGRTTIMIAHRLSTIRDADNILFFENGQVVESGNHDQLLNLGGKYSDLVKAQQFRNINVKESRLSLSSGSEIFRRGSLQNNSDHSRSIQSEPENDSFVETEVPNDEKKTTGLLDVFKNAEGNYFYMFIGLCFAMIRGLIMPALALLFGWVFSGFTYLILGQPGKMLHQMVLSVIAFCSVGVGVFISQWICSTIFAIVSENLALRFRVQSFQSLLYQDASYFDNPAHSQGKLITRLATDAPNVKAIVDSRVLQIIYAIVSIIANIVIAFTYCWQVAILGTSLIIFLAVTMIGLSYKISILNEKIMKEDEAGRIAIEIIENVQTIQLLTRNQYFYICYQNASKAQKRRELKKGIIEAINYSISQSFMYFMMCFGYAVGIRIIYQGDKKARDTFRGIMSMTLGAVSVMGSAQYFPELVRAKSAARMLFNIIYQKPKTGDIMLGEVPEIRGNVTFEDVRFSYPQAENEAKNQAIMKGLHWNALRGQTVALVGPSGSGKSTCIGMLERFYDTTGGRVLIDGVDIKSLSLYHLRTRMSLVGQEPRLFSGTIKENICLGLKDVPIDKINKALELANASRFLANLPAGIDTDVGERGSQLSGGQKQRVAIARALVREPKILLLDEATSALDSESERAVQEALDRAREGRTCITIAHRLSSIQNSDLIVFIENGRVQESGNHERLMQMKGKYYNLIKRQDPDA